MTIESSVLSPNVVQFAPGMARNATVVVLGGSGFAGAAIIRSLLRAGFGVVSAQRRTAAPRAGVRQRRWDVAHAADIRNLLGPARCVVNAVAGDSHTMLAATRALAQAEVEGCRIVHVSSMDVYGRRRGYVRETAPLHASTAYGAAKIACEVRLAGSGATILRPGLVYGPGSLQWVDRLGRLLFERRLGDLGKHGDGRCNLVYARDLGEAVVAAIRNPASRGLAINLGMTAPPRWNDYLVALARAIGAVPVRRIPGWHLVLESLLVAPPIHLAGLALHRLGRPDSGLPPIISPALKRILRHDIVLDCSLAERLLPFRRTGLADGLTESAAWFLEAHGLDTA